MNKQFKVGDRIKCIDAEGEPHLTLGKEYTVLRIGVGMLNMLIVVVENTANYPWRFELVESVSTPPLLAWELTMTIMGKVVTLAEAKKLYSELGNILDHITELE